MMNKILGKTLVAAALTGSLLLVTKPALAAVRCETYYGGEVCVRTGELQINKKVWNPEGEFVDNLGITDYKFAPGEEITFRLEIKNVGDETFDKVYVNDTLPSYLELASGSLYFEISDLTVDETEEREFKARVLSADKLPNDKNIICVVNAAEAWSGDERDRDTAQVCLEKKVLGITIIPVTGPKNLLFFSLISTLLALSSFILIRKSFLK